MLNYCKVYGKGEEMQMKTHAGNLTVCALAALTSLTVPAAEWPVSLSTVNGMTPSQQLTNAVTQASAGDTIRFEAGTYQLDGASFTATQTGSGAGSVTVTSKNYVLADKKLHFVGASADKWDDATILRGNGNDRFFYGTATGSTFRNLTFENFASCDRTDISINDNNLSPIACGGAIVFANNSNGSGSTMGVYTANLVSNCVFRGNVSRSGGAVVAVYAVDSLFTNNVAASYNGGVGVKVDMLRCRCVDNRAADQGGAVWWQGSGSSGLRDSEFIGNSSKRFSAVVDENSGTISNCVFRGNRATASDGGALSLRQNSKIIDCTFEDNSAVGHGGAVYSGAADNNGNGGKGGVFTRCRFTGNRSGNSGGAVYEAHNDPDGPLVFRDCSFSNNYATVAGGALCGGASTNCTFFANSCGAGDSGKDERGGAVYLRTAGPGGLVNCTFTSNHFTKVASSKTVGAAVFASTSNLVKGCVFYGNYVTNKVNEGYFSVVYGINTTAKMRIVDCAFSNNYSTAGGLVRNAYCTNTVFFGNEVPYGGVVNNSTAVDCRFIGNKKVDTFWGYSFSTYNGTPDANVPSGDATSSTLLRCDMDLGCLYDCVAVDCWIHTLTNKGAYCVFYGHNVATNCLISNCNPPDQTRGVIYRWGSITARHVSGSDYVNCTFVENKFPKFLFHAKENGIVTPFKNCIWANNKTQYNSLYDVGYDVSNDTSTPVDSGIRLSNCVYGVVGCAPGVSKNISWTDLGGNRTVSAADLKMAGDRAAQLGVHKYSLRAESPVLGMGDASVFAATDVDFAGNLRLRNGKLDPGCFQCWLNILGTYLIMR